MEKIGVLGAGVMGTGISQAFGMKGFEVVVRDLSEASMSKSQRAIEKGLSRLVEKGKLEAKVKEETLKAIVYTEKLKDLEDCDLVIEAATENREVKKLIFQELDAVCMEHTIFATNTSSLSITEVASVTGRPEKVLGMHFF